MLYLKCRTCTLVRKREEEMPVAVASWSGASINLEQKKGEEYGITVHYISPYFPYPAPPGPPRTLLRTQWQKVSHYIEIERRSPIPCTMLLQLQWVQNAQKKTAPVVSFGS